MRSIHAVRARWRAARSHVRSSAVDPLPSVAQDGSGAPPGTRRAASAARRHGQRGAAAVEFALIAPVLFVLVLGIIDFGLYINAAAVVNNAAREGVRAASLGASSSEIVVVTEEALSQLPGSSDAGTFVTVSCLTPGGGTCSSFDSGAAAGGTAIVEVTYLHDWLTPLGIGDDITIVKSSEMRIE
jgi:hypothetical protein